MTRLIVAAFEFPRREDVDPAPRDLRQPTVNITAVVGIALAIPHREGPLLPSLLSTTNLTGSQWLIGASPAVVLFEVFLT